MGVSNKPDGHYPTQPVTLYVRSEVLSVVNVKMGTSILEEPVTSIFTVYEQTMLGNEEIKQLYKQTFSHLHFFSQKSVLTSFALSGSQCIHCPSHGHALFPDFPISVHFFNCRASPSTLKKAAASPSTLKKAAASSSTLKKEATASSKLLVIFY
jgi:hypothetical protein